MDALRHKRLEHRPRAGVDGRSQILRCCLGILECLRNALVFGVRYQSVLNWHIRSGAADILGAFHGLPKACSIFDTL